MATALVTGGTSGIGLAFARALARRGDGLVLVARDEQRLARVAGELRQAGAPDVEVLPADLAVRADVARVAERVADTTRPVDLLVDNAGFGVHARLTDPDPAELERAIAVMCTAVAVLGGAAGRAMRERGHGAIVVTSSIAGSLTMGGYSAVKAFATTYAESLAVELAGTGVTATALCPGWVRTEFHERAGITMSHLPDAIWTDADEVVEQCLADVARGRVVSVPTLRYTIVASLLRKAPRGLVRRISGALASSRRRSGAAA